MTEQHIAPPATVNGGVTWIEPEAKPATIQWNTRAVTTNAYSEQEHLKLIEQSERWIDRAIAEEGYDIKRTILTRTLTIKEGGGFDLLTVYLFSGPAVALKVTSYAL